MRLIIAGSRTVLDPRPVARAFREFQDALYQVRPRMEDVTEIVSGTAKGPDQTGEAIATLLEIPCVRFPADWEKYGKAAGHIRNGDMAEYACEGGRIGGLIAVRENGSRGTGNMIEIAKARNFLGLVVTRQGYEWFGWR